MKHYPPILDRLLSQLAARLSPAGIAEMCEWLDGGGADQVANVVEGSRGLTALSQRIERALESVRPDPTSEPERAAANLLAMWMLHRFSGDAMQTAAERWTLDRYTGWGGLGIKKWMPGFPPGPMPEAEGLLHEYYTPRRVWRAIWQSLAAKNYKLDGDALEPSAGIGRALAQFDRANWTALEASPVSSQLLRARFPNAEIHEGYAEGWIAHNLHRRFDLVLCNPPYGARGAAKELDPNGFDSKQAYTYFCVRTAELLKAGGHAVYIIPTGLLTSVTPVLSRARQALLRRAHLLAAFRLPSMPEDGATYDDVAYENFVVDVLFVRGRGGTAVADAPGDVGILEGGYYRAHPNHILGRVLGEGEFSDAPTLATGGKVRRGMQVVGRFEAFPDFSPRPSEDVEIKVGKAEKRARGGIAVAKQGELGEDVPQRLRDAVALGMRVDHYLAAGDAPVGHGELIADLYAWLSLYGPPDADAGLRALAAAQQRGAQRFLAVWEGSTLLPALRAPPADRGYRVPPGLAPEAAAVHIADHLFRKGGGVGITAAAVAEHLPLREPQVVDALLRSGWCVNQDLLEPPEHYYSGFLWPKFDWVRGRAEPWAQHQTEELRRKIGWVGGSKLLKDTGPTQPWIPTDIWVQWATECGYWTGMPVKRVDGLFMPAHVAGYGALNNTDKLRTPGFERSHLCLVGWINEDNALFVPERQERLDENGNKVTIPAEQTRQALRDEWTASWHTWLNKHDDIAERIEEVFNRRLRGYVSPKWSHEPIDVARWNPAITLHGYQNAGGHQLITNGAGLLAFDVGLGKTFTGIKVVARLRQEGRARRPVILVPNTIAWKWYRDFGKVLPDYRVVVIGSNRAHRKGRLVASLDTPEERAAKWTALQAGAYDVAIVTYSAFARQQVDADFVGRYVGGTVAIRRHITLALDQAEAEKDASKKKGAPTPRRTERGEADLQARARTWVGDMLAPPKGWTYDPGIDWHALGIDCLVVDEAQNFKNLFYSSREGSADRKAAKRAWALDFRCASVREHTGGGGVFLLSATPMKNAATEFYNLLHLVNPKVWEQVGVADPESWINLFAHMELRPVTDGAGKTRDSMVVTGFHHIDVLRGVVYRWATFKTAAEVGLKLPKVERRQHIVNPTAAQLYVFQALHGELADIEDKIRDMLRKGASANPAMAGVLRGLRMKAQGIKARMYLAALHPGLVTQDEEIEKPTAAGVVQALDRMQHGSVESAEAGPKLVECAKTVLATRPDACATSKAGEEWCLTCGHIVFVENLKVHHWLRELLIKGGMPAERIAILNAEDAPDLEQRQQIAEGFNGAGNPDADAEEDRELVMPKYDVVIANAVAYEGIDLQRRTCAIHHLDVPWEPATLQQRNGRGVRQGARYGDISIHFYFVAKSGEGQRLQRIERKRGIMTSLYEGGDLATNTVMADTVERAEDVEDDDDTFGAFAPPEVQARRKAAAAEDARNKELERAEAARRAAVTALADALQAHRRMERGHADPQRAAALRQEANETWDRLSAFPADLWPYPWHDLARRAREAEPEDVLVTAGYPPLIVGDVWALEETSLPAEITRVTAEHAWVRFEDRAGQLTGDEPRHLLRLVEDEISEAAVKQWVRDRSHLYRHPAQLWANMGDRWCALAWPHYVALARQLMGPMQLADGEIGMRPVSDTTLPCTRAGWHRFVSLARQSTQKWSDLNAVAKAWWDRELPKGIVGRDA